MSGEESFGLLAVCVCVDIAPTHGESSRIRCECTHPPPQTARGGSSCQLGVCVCKPPPLLSFCSPPPLSCVEDPTMDRNFCAASPFARTTPPRRMSILIIPVFRGRHPPSRPGSRSAEGFPLTPFSRGIWRVPKKESSDFQGSSHFAPSVRTVIGIDIVTGHVDNSRPRACP